MIEHPILTEIVHELNLRAVNYRIGALQSLRKELKGFEKRPGRSIFSALTTSERGQFAFHHGGRKELQFNVGLEPSDGVMLLRHGVAFSLETSQTLPTIDELVPKVDRFNEFLRLHPQEFLDFRMWHYDSRDERSPNQLPAPIAPELVVTDTFICLGKLTPIASLNYDLILADFDRLLPLYEFVEGDSTFPTTADPSEGFVFKPGFTVKPEATAVNLAERVLDVRLRHNELQHALYDALVKVYGTDNVGTEQSNSGVRVDVVLRQGSEYWYYEIKNASSARACIREALAQLLEYAYWPGTQEATRLIIVGEPEFDPEARVYIDRLRSRFALPIEYQQIQMEQRILKTAPNTGPQPDGTAGAAPRG